MYSTWDQVQHEILYLLTTVSVLEGESKNKNLEQNLHSQSIKSYWKDKTFKKKIAIIGLENTNISCSYIYLQVTAEKGNSPSGECF